MIPPCHQGRPIRYFNIERWRNPSVSPGQLPGERAASSGGWRSFDPTLSLRPSVNLPVPHDYISVALRISASPTYNKLAYNKQIWMCRVTVADGHDGTNVHGDTFEQRRAMLFASGRKPPASRVSIVECMPIIMFLAMPALSEWSKRAVYVLI